MGGKVFFSDVAIRLAGCLLREGKALRLNLNIDMDQRNRRRGYAWYARRVPKRARAHPLQLLIHLAREAADLAVIKPVRDHTLLGLLESLDGLALLVKIAGIFNLSFDSLHFVARSRGKPAFNHRLDSFKVFRITLSHHTSQILNNNFRPLQELRER